MQLRGRAPTESRRSADARLLFTRCSAVALFGMHSPARLNFPGDIARSRGQPISSRARSVTQLMPSCSAQADNGLRSPEPGIPVLLFGRGPSAIAFAVGAVVVHAIEAHARRHEAHVVEEPGERLPFCVIPDASTSATDP
jgi:hypothetical protein